METAKNHPALPDIFVGKEVINNRVKAYLDTKYPVLNEALHVTRPTSQETRSIWYPKEHIETLVSEMELTGADGLRIYIGAYGEQEVAAPGQLCLLMVLTRAGALTDSHKDIIYENEPDFEMRLGATERSLEPYDPASEGDGRLFNYGAPCPPICITDDQEFPFE